MTRLISDLTTPVLVLGAAHHGGLSITRSLGQVGVPVYNLDRSKWNPAFSSRYCCGSLLWDLGAELPETSVNRLIRFARELRRPCVLTAITDLGALFIADNADSLRESFLFPAQPPYLTRSLYNKRRMQELANAAGLPTARTCFPSGIDDAMIFAANAEYPVMFKAVDGIRLAACGVPTKAIVRSRSELEKLLQRLRDEDLSDLMLQEYIPGGADSIWMFDGYFNDRSKCLFGITAHKLRQYPAYTGASSLAVCSPNETVYEMTCHFMETIGYRGVVDLGYRYDARDGKYKILDVNPRVGSSFRLFTTRNDMDAVRALYCGLTQQPVPLDAPSWGRKWIVEDLDLVSAARCFIDGNLGLTEWLRSYRGIQETAVWSSNDWKGSLGIFISDFHNLFATGKARKQPSAGRTDRTELEGAMALPGDDIAPPK